MHINPSFLSRSESMGWPEYQDLCIPLHSRGKTMKLPRIMLKFKGKTNISVKMFPYKEFKSILENALNYAKKFLHLKKNICLLCVYTIWYRVK